jgi:hypothetical protein
MTKQVYYGISAVHYSDDPSHIERVRVHEISKDRIKPNGIIDGSLKRGRVLTVDEVVDEIDKGKKFITLIRKAVWVKGRTVGKVPLLTFIRSYPTRTNPKPKDDLEDLPKFRWPKVKSRLKRVVGSAKRAHAIRRAGATKSIQRAGIV